MRTQVILLLALVAVAQCQYAPVTSCLREAVDLGESIKTIIARKEFNIGAILQVYAKINNTVNVCGQELAEIKKARENSLQAINLNLNCIAQIMSSIDKIKKLKGQFKGGVNFEAVLAELQGLGQDVSALKAACTK